MAKITKLFTDVGVNRIENKNYVVVLIFISAG